MPYWVSSFLSDSPILTASSVAMMGSFDYCFLFLGQLFNTARIEGERGRFLPSLHLPGISCYKGSPTTYQRTPTQSFDTQTNL